MSGTFRGEFARLSPHNSYAHQLWSRSFVFVAAEDPYHLNFMVELDKEQSYEEPVESDTNYETDYSDPSHIADLKSGFFTISFDRTKLPKFGNVGWRVGRGVGKLPASNHRGVDLLLAKPGDKHSRSLASYHFRLFLNWSSGFLVLEATSSKSALLECNIGGRWETLGLNQKRLLYQPSALLRAGACEYELTYVISEEHRSSFMEWRNTFIQDNHAENAKIYPHFSVVPGDNLAVMKKYVLLETKDKGAFGCVSQGLDKVTGDLIAIKELYVRDRASIQAIEAELKIGERFTNKDGLLPILDSFCEHDRARPCRSNEKFYILLPFAVSNFSALDLKIDEIYSENLALLQQIFHGLSTLHEQGCMHRDITPGNMLVLSRMPPRAAICDFGKAIDRSSSIYTYIGPIHTLAPEVWLVGDRGSYSQSIDIWALGYAIAQFIGYVYRGNDRITVQRHSEILCELRGHARDHPRLRDLVRLTVSMLAWNPSDRPTAVEANRDPCWAPIQQNADSNEDRSDKNSKKARLSIAEGGRSTYNNQEDVVTTQPFGVETQAIVDKIIDTKADIISN